MEVYPKRAFTFVESKPDEDIYEIRVTLKDVPGALAKAASLVAEAGINVKTSIVFYPYRRKSMDSGRHLLTFQNLKCKLMN